MHEMQGPDDLLLPVFKDNVAYRWIGSTNMVAELIHNSTGDVRRKELVFLFTANNKIQSRRDFGHQNICIQQNRVFGGYHAGPSEGINKTVFILELPGGSLRACSSEQRSS